MSNNRFAMPEKCQNICTPSRRFCRSQSIDVKKVFICEFSDLIFQAHFRAVRLIAEIKVNGGQYISFWLIKIIRLIVVLVGFDFVA